METDYTLQVKAWNCLWSNLGLCFHFLPGDPKDLICRVDSELSRLIIDKVFGCYVEGGGRGVDALPISPYYVCAYGIALHGLQDSYFHQNWVGKFDKRNCLPVWAKDRLTFSIGPPYGHAALFVLPDVANAVYLDPRTNNKIDNRKCVNDALAATGRVLGLAEIPLEILEILNFEPDYEGRKQRLRDLAGMPELRFSGIRRDMWNRYKVPFQEAAFAQAKIVKTYLNKGE